MNDLFVSGFLKTLCVLKNYLPVETISSDGVLWVTEQRPSFAFDGLNMEQFKQFVLATFNGLLKNLDKQLRP